MNYFNTKYTDLFKKQSLTHCLSAVEPTVWWSKVIVKSIGAINYMEDKRYFKLKLEPFAIVDIDIVFSVKKSKQISLLKQ